MTVNNSVGEAHQEGQPEEPGFKPHPGLSARRVPRSVPRAGYSKFLSHAVSQTVFLEPAIEGAAAESQSFRSRTDVSLITGHGLSLRAGTPRLPDSSRPRGPTPRAPFAIPGRSNAPSHLAPSGRRAPQRAPIHGHCPARVLEEHLHRPAFETGQAFPVSLGKLAEEIIRQKRQVLAPLAQRRQVNLDRVQPEKQVFSKSPGLDLLRDVGIGCRQDAHIHAARFR